jgi:hypothetical protein
LVFIQDCLNDPDLYNLKTPRHQHRARDN